eukprot:NODE_26886_length_534_cov_0.572482.p2 GENE.NODE_26886_length_534_cov_0.572482~~NODE_26886_length_534_cov_0.572482.p2  ORF type:complete len:89 (+),score=24.65 NODE_26886_length_534_cov_0.572482:268-534(+)
MARPSRPAHLLMVASTVADEMRAPLLSTTLTVPLTDVFGCLAMSGVLLIVVVYLKSPPLSGQGERGMPTEIFTTGKKKKKKKKKSTLR